MKCYNLTIQCNSIPNLFISEKRLGKELKKEIKNGSLTTEDIFGRLNFLIKEKAKLKGHTHRVPVLLTFLCAHCNIFIVAHPGTCLW